MDDGTPVRISHLEDRAIPGVLNLDPRVRREGPIHRALVSEDGTEAIRKSWIELCAMSAEMRLMAKRRRRPTPSGARERRRSSASTPATLAHESSMRKAEEEKPRRLNASAACGRTISSLWAVKSISRQEIAVKIQKAMRMPLGADRRRGPDSEGSIPWRYSYTSQ